MDSTCSKNILLHFGEIKHHGLVLLTLSGGGNARCLVGRPYNGGGRQSLWEPHLPHDRQMTKSLHWKQPKTVMLDQVRVQNTSARNSQAIWTGDNCWHPFQPGTWPGDNRPCLAQVDPFTSLLRQPAVCRLTSWRLRTLNQTGEGHNQRHNRHCYSGYVKICWLMLILPILPYQICWKLVNDATRRCLRSFFEATSTQQMMGLKNLLGLPSGFTMQNGLEMDKKHNLDKISFIVPVYHILDIDIVHCLRGFADQSSTHPTAFGPRT